jgi:hypothetical protein
MSCLTEIYRSWMFSPSEFLGLVTFFFFWGGGVNINSTCNEIGSGVETSKGPAILKQYAPFLFRKEEFTIFSAVGN